MFFFESLISGFLSFGLRFVLKNRFGFENVPRGTISFKRLLCAVVHKIGG